MAQSKNEFYLRRIHSLLGIIPIGAFLVVHLLVNHQATQGAEAFNKASNFMVIITISNYCRIFIYIHSVVISRFVWYTHCIYSKRKCWTLLNFRNWMFFFQRVSGILTFIFIGIHLWQTRLQKAFYGKEVNYDLMHETLQHPGWAIFYIICIIAVVFHFANGLWSFLVTWGGLQSPKSQRVFTWVSLIVFLVISYIGVTAIIAFM
ncbi:succinate dehydrogenase [Staphylococcus aureus]